MKGLANKTHYTLRLSAVIVAIIAASSISAAQIEARRILSQNAGTQTGKAAIIAESTVEEIITVLEKGGYVPPLA